MFWKFEGEIKILIRRDWIPQTSLYNIYLEKQEIYFENPELKKSLQCYFSQIYSYHKKLFMY